MARRRSGGPRKERGGVRDSVKDAEFFKVHLSSDQLSIPPEYVKKFKKTIKEKVILKNIKNGKEWYVDVKETPDGTFLQNGWKAFIDYHGLKVGEFLVFRYVGAYSFMVKIFGSNGCKRDKNLESKATDDVKSEDESDEEMKQKQTCRKRASPQINDDDLSDDGRTEHSERSGEVYEVQEEVYEVQEEVGPSKQPDSSKESEYTGKGPFFTPKFPRTKTTYTWSIPVDLIKDYNLDLPENMYLCNSEGKEWEVKLFPLRGRTMLGKGLHKFFEENNVRENIDRCKFTFETERSSKYIRVEVIRG